MSRHFFNAFVDTHLARKRKGVLTIFKYHRVLPAPDALVREIDAATFSWQCAFLQRFYNVMTLSEGAARLQKQSLPPRAVCITFDDGYEDNVSIALPILQRYRLPATFFVLSGFFDGTAMWNDCVIESVRQYAGEQLDLQHMNLGMHATANDAQKIQCIKHILAQLKYLEMHERHERVQQLIEHCRADIPKLMMSTRQLKQLHAAGMEVGGHTRNHPILSRLSPEQALLEIQQGKARLEDELSQRLLVFAYPNGQPDQDYHKAHVKMVKELGFVAAVSTAQGACRAGQDVFQLPRVSPAVRNRYYFAGRMAQNARLTPVVAQL